MVDPRKNATAATAPTTRPSSSTTSPTGPPRPSTRPGKASTQAYDRDGLVVSSTDQEEQTTTVTLDARGQVTEAKSPFKDDAGTITYRYTRFEYDQVGNRTKVITPRGVATATVADDFVHRTVYDAAGPGQGDPHPVRPVRRALQDGRTRRRTPTTPVGRLQDALAPPSKARQSGTDTIYTYCDNGAVKTSTDPWDIITSYDYNAARASRPTRTLTSAGGHRPGR